MKLERLSLQFETKGFRWRRSLASVKTEDLDSFFPSPDKLLIRILSTENFHSDGDVGGRKRLGRGQRFPAKNVKDLKQTTMATATRTRKKRSNWQNNSSARAFHNFVHFLAVPCKTTTWNHHNLRRLRTETATANYFNFHLELNTSFLRDAEVEVWRRMRRSHFRNSN